MDGPPTLFTDSAFLIERRVGLMQTRMSRQALLAGTGLLLLAGCSMSRGTLAGKELPDSSSMKTADANPSDSDAPPAQPGARKSKGSRNKLAGWLNNKAPKKESIPLERTDSKSEEDDDAGETEPNFWTHSDQPAVTTDPKLAKSKGPTTDKASLFEP